MTKANFIRIGWMAILLGVTANGGVIHAQNSFEDYKKRAHQQFEEFKAAKQKEFESYRERVNREFADYMSKAWQEFKAEPAIPAPDVPEPPAPVVAPPDVQPSDEAFPISKVTPVAEVPEKPVPVLPEADKPIPEEKPVPEKTPVPEVKPLPEEKPIPEKTPVPEVKPAPEVKPLPEEKPVPEKTPVPEEKPVPEATPTPDEKPTIPSPPPAAPPVDAVSFYLYGEKCEVPFDKSLRFSLLGTDEKTVARAWQHLASDKSVATVRSCVNLRDKMRLPDWGYIRLIENFAKSVFPDKRNEAALLQMFLLTQSGYKVRIGRCGSNLIVLIPSNETIYNYTYIPIDGTNYYVIDSTAGSGGTYVFNHSFPGEQIFSLMIAEQPKLKNDPANPRHFVSAFDRSIDLDVNVNKNLIDFYNNYPLSDYWNIYAKASLSENVKNQLYPKLRESIEGKNEVEAANVLLHFIQTAFDYKTDREQFGRERAFFPDETFFYPFCDCEDRAILYSVLVKDLIGLDVVLVHYPGHLATAVRFNEDLPGDHFNINGQKYLVCDPTYINSNVGTAMEMFKDSKAEIVKI